METPTILYLNNRYVNSLEELKVYFGSKLNEAQKGELIAAFRDKVLYDWLNEGGEAEKQIAGDMLPILDQHLGNGEVLKKIAELFDVPNPLIADYKFVDHAEYLGCDVLGSDDEQTQHPTVPNTGVIHIKKGVTKCRIVFKFKILAPENDFLSLQMEISPKIENAMSMKQAKLDLVGKKNETKTIELDIDVEKLCKECSLTLSHDNSVVGHVTIDNHENTDKVIEATEEIFSVGYHKMDMAARVCMKQSIKTNQSDNNQSSLRFGFYDIQGNKVLAPELKLLKNPMYPDLDFGFYYRKIQEKGKNKIRLYHINEKGYQDLGVFSFANPLNENLVAVLKTNESKFYGIIDKTGKTILEDNKVGKIYGINKDGCLVCEVRPGAKGLANLQGEELRKDKIFNHYFVVPCSDCIYAFEGYENDCRLYFSNIKMDSFYQLNSYLFIDLSNIKTIDSIYSFNSNSFVFIIGVDEEGKKTYSGWFDLSSINYLNYYRVHQHVNSTNDLQIWLNKPLFPLFRSDSEIHVTGSVYSDAFFSSEYNYVNEIKPAIISERWMLKYDNSWYMYENRENRFDKISNFYYGGDLFAVYCCSQKQVFIHFENNTIELVFLKDELKPEKKQVISFEGIKKIESIVSYGNYIAIKYLYQADGVNEETHCSLVISREGEEDFRDEWNEFSFVCGPFEDKYYYLDRGELWCTDKNKKNKEKLSGWNANNLLNASELYPLGTTGHFVVKSEKGCQIIDNKGTKLCDPFYDFDISVTNCRKEMVMDYIYNSQYLPIKNEEGKCGLIDTNGKIIVPCEYDEVEDLNSIFKREGIVIF